MAQRKQWNRKSRTQVARTTAEKTVAGQPGYVYVLTNPSMPGLVKVGRTARDPRKRASELRTTGVPGRFKVEYQAKARDAVLAEGIAHRMLSSHRVANDREFFKVSVSKASQAVSTACMRRRSLHPAFLWILVILFGLFAAWSNGRI